MLGFFQDFYPGFAHKSYLEGKVIFMLLLEIMKLPARKCYIDVGLSLTFIEMFSIQEKGISKVYRTGLGKYQLKIYLGALMLNAFTE